MDANINLGSYAVNPEFNPFQVPAPEVEMDVNDINFDDIDIDNINVNNINIDDINTINMADINVNDINVNDIDAITMADIDFNLNGNSYTDFNPTPVTEAVDSADMDIDLDLYTGRPNFDPFQVDDGANTAFDLDPVLNPLAEPEFQVGTNRSVHNGTDPRTGLLDTPDLDDAMMSLLMP
jgi:hypothetical protein